MVPPSPPTGNNAVPGWYLKGGKGSNLIIFMVLPPLTDSNSKHHPGCCNWILLLMPQISADRWGMEVEIQLPLKRSSIFQHLFPNPSWLVWGRASHHQKLAPIFPGIDSYLMVTKRDFLKMEASLWLNGKSQNVAKGWLSTLCCWEAAVHTLDLSWKKMDVKLMMMMMVMIQPCFTRNH